MQKICLRFSRFIGFTNISYYVSQEKYFLVLVRKLILLDILNLVVATDLLEKQVVCWVLLLYEKLEKKSYLIQNRNSNNDTLVQVYVFFVLLIFVTDTVT